MNKYYILLLLITILLSGCLDTNTIEGKYYSEEDPSAYIELKADGKYVVSQDKPFAGEYYVDENNITLVHLFGSFELTKNGNTITDPDGIKWVKIK